MEAIAESTFLFGDFVLTGYLTGHQGPVVFSLHHGGHHQGMGDRSYIMGLVGLVARPRVDGTDLAACPDHVEHMAMLVTGSDYAAAFTKDAYVGASSKVCGRCLAPASYEWTDTMAEPEAAAAADAADRIENQLNKYQEAGCITL